MCHLLCLEPQCFAIRYDNDHIWPTHSQKYSNLVLYTHFHDPNCPLEESTISTMDVELPRASQHLFHFRSDQLSPSMIYMNAIRSHMRHFFHWSCIYSTCDVTISQTYFALSQCLLYQASENNLQSYDKGPNITNFKNLGLPFQWRHVSCWLPFAGERGKYAIMVIPISFQHSYL